MKTMLIFATSAIIVFGMAYAREVMVSPVVAHHEVGIAQLSMGTESDVLCTRRDIANTNSKEDKTIHKSVDCDE
jgi:hypothetical protein